MTIHNYDELVEHHGHKLVVAKYADRNATIECKTCGEVLVSYDVDEWHIDTPADAEALNEDHKWLLNFVRNIVHNVPTEMLTQEVATRKMRSGGVP